MKIFFLYLRLFKHKKKTHFELNRYTFISNFRVHHILKSALAADYMFSVLVPAPRHLTLERQLNKSVLIGWSSPEQPGCNQIESYHVYVDGVLKVTVKATERTRALVEGVDSNRVSLIQPKKN